MDPESLTHISQSLVTIYWIKIPVLRIRIRCLFDPWFQDPGWVINLDLDLGFGSGINNPIIFPRV
jgi:hypothetical protein